MPIEIETKLKESKLHLKDEEANIIVTVSVEPSATGQYIVDAPVPTRFNLTEPEGVKLEIIKSFLKITKVESSDIVTALTNAMTTEYVGDDSGRYFSQCPEYAIAVHDTDFEKGWELFLQETTYLILNVAWQSNTNPYVLISEDGNPLPELISQATHNTMKDIEHNEVLSLDRYGTIHGYLEAQSALFRVLDSKQAL